MEKILSRTKRQRSELTGVHRQLVEAGLESSDHERMYEPKFGVEDAYRDVADRLIHKYLYRGGSIGG